jgi:hypothetical protein
MGGRRSAYELSQSQVMTPEHALALFWQLVGQRRQSIGSVLDLGAGDCRFGKGGNFRRYVGVEIDKTRAVEAQVPQNGTLVHGCVFRYREADFDVCIGNPPYARHHDIENGWKEKVIRRMRRELNVVLNSHCNLYIYFFCLALLKTHEKGLVALVIPYEWVSRPSSKALREYIQHQKWNAWIYRFKAPIFDGVMTTASISIVDKDSHEGQWRYHDITADDEIIERDGITDSKRGVLRYASRGNIWGLRGLSPGTQKVFTLTEGERIRAGLKKRDVVPCVTTLKNVPRALRILSKAAFRKHFIESGDKCWLIRSYQARRSDALEAYLQAVPAESRNTYTCRNQIPWFKFRPHPVPQVLFSSGFTSFGPKVLINTVGARAIGSVWGIHGEKRVPLRRLQEYLLSVNFEKQVVPHAEKLKKVEVKQLNAVLNRFIDRERRNGGSRSR